METLVKNAADEAQVKNAADKAQILRDMELEDHSIVMSTFQGRRFVHRLLEQCKVFSTGFAGEEVYETHVNLGKREVGLRLIANIDQACPKLYATLIQEKEKYYNV